METVLDYAFNLLLVGSAGYFGIGFVLYVAERASAKKEKVSIPLPEMKSREAIALTPSVEQRELLTMEIPDDSP